MAVVVIVRRDLHVFPGAVDIDGMPKIMFAGRMIVGVTKASTNSK